MGGDQGGSIRIPCSFGGLVGLKPTTGLIPYTAITGADPSLDHTGPMTRTVEEAALTMDAVAGRDGLDPRQPHDLEVQDYSGALDEDISEMTVGVLEEGFGFEESDPEVDAVVKDAIEDLEAAGADITEVSIPRHREGRTISTPVSRYGTTQVMKQNGAASGFDGWYDTGAMEYLGRALESHSSDLPPNLKATLLAGEYIQQMYGGAVYGKAQNLTIEMQAAYDEALEDVDALVMPTSPITPPEHGELLGMEQLLGEDSVAAMSKNTSIFDVTHHPALTVPCGTTDETPVGMMLVGERFDDATLLKLGYAYEQYTQ
jgi:amidase